MKWLIRVQRAIAHMHWTFEGRTIVHSHSIGAFDHEHLPLRYGKRLRSWAERDVTRYPRHTTA